MARWIVPLEKRYDYLTTVTGKKIDVPFELLLIFSTNLDPSQLVDEAFLRRIKFKIEVRDPDEAHFRKIWALVCKSHNVELDEKGLNYMIDKWYKAHRRPFRMCQPRDILDQMLSIAKKMKKQSALPYVPAAANLADIEAEMNRFGISCPTPNGQ